MRRSLPLLLILFLSSSFHRAESCKEIAAEFESKVKSNPGSVRVLFGKALKSHPGCAGLLLEKAITASNADNGTLAQLVRLAVEEQPEQVSVIAEAAILAAPDRVDVIRNVFAAKQKKKPIVATPVFEDSASGNEVSSVSEDPSLPVYRSRRPADSDDVAEKALQAIDELLAKLGMDKDGREKATEKETKPDQIKLSAIDPVIAISTLGISQRDNTDETVVTADPKPLRIEDAEPETAKRE